MKDNPETRADARRGLTDGDLPGVSLQDPQAAPDEAERLIRSLIVEQARATNADQLPPLVPDPEPRDQGRTRRAPKPPVSRAGRRGLPLRGAHPGGGLPRLGAFMRAMSLRALPPAIRGWRPTAGQVALGVLACVVLLRPLLFALVAFGAVWLGLIVYLTLGPARCAELGRGIWSRFAARHPARAGRLRARADACAERVDRVLDRLPEAWADRLALPDFSAAPGDDPARPDPFDRLARDMRDV